MNLSLLITKLLLKNRIPLYTLHIHIVPGKIPVLKSCLNNFINHNIAFANRIYLCRIKEKFF
jgi:hypothetical protein